MNTLTKSNISFELDFDNNFLLKGDITPNDKVKVSELIYAEILIEEEVLFET